MRVLSLFNGMNCIGLALTQLGVEFELYASEIDKHANKVSHALFPNTVNLGDVTKIDLSTLPKFDLIVAGSPCQGFSFAGKQLNFEDPRSKLFFNFVDILNHCKAQNPNIKFLLENVRMKKEYQKVISDELGVEPLLINSALVSAQNRNRLYWTNIKWQTTKLFGNKTPGIGQPKDRKIFLKDILQLDVDEKYIVSNKCATFVSDPNRLKKKFTAINPDKAITMTARAQQSWNATYIKSCRQVGRKIVNGKRDDKSNTKAKQQIEVRKDDKSGCLTTVQKDSLVIQLNPSKESGGVQPHQQNRYYSTDGKYPCLDTDSRKNVKDNTIIRRLTPTECCRLQTIPDWAIEKILNCGVSDSQIYKMLGNGWTVEVIVWILSHMDEIKK